MFTAQIGARQSQIFAQRICKQASWLDHQAVGPTIDCQADRHKIFVLHHRFLSARSAALANACLVRTLARWRR